MKWHWACTVDSLRSGACEVLVEGRVIAVFQNDSGLFAIDGMCAHQGGPIAKGQLDGCCVTCPWHGWQYDVTNGKNILTGRQMLETYPVEQRDEDIWIGIAAATA